MRSRGSAPVDFVLVSVPLLLLSVTIIGVTFNGLAKTVAQDVAIDSARFGALADQNASAALDHAKSVLSGPILRVFRAEVSASRSSSSTNCIVQVLVRFKTIGFGFISEALRVEEKGNAICEIPER